MAVSYKIHLSPGKDTHKKLEAVGQGAVTIRNLMEAIRGTSAFDAKALKDAKISDLNTHLATAQKLAEAWINPVAGDTKSPGQEKILDILGTFGHINDVFVNDGGMILEKAKASPGGLKGEDLKLVHELIGRLYKEVGEAKKKSVDAQNILKYYSDGLNTAHQQFLSDKTKAETVLGGLEYQKTGAALFEMPLSEVASLDKGKVSESLKTAFSNHNLYTVDEVAVYAAGQKWGVASTSSSGKTSGGTAGYKVSAGYVIEKEGATLKVYTGSGGKLLSLMAEYHSDQDAMNTDLSIIAGGAVGAVVGVLIIAVGALADIATAGAATGVVLAGAAVAVAGAGTAIYGGVDYANKSKDASKMLQELANDEHLLAILPHIGTTLTNLAANASAAKMAIDDITTMWESVHSALGNLKDDMDTLKSETFAEMIPGDVTQALNGWKDVARKANIVSYNMTNMHVMKLPHGVTMHEFLAHPEKYVDPALIEKYHANAPAHAH